MVDGKWVISPELGLRDAILQGMKEGVCVLAIGAAFFFVHLKIVGSILLFAGLFFIFFSPWLYRKATVRGRCPACDHKLLLVVRDGITCPFCKQPIDLYHKEDNPS